VQIAANIKPIYASAGFAMVCDIVGDTHDEITIYGVDHKSKIAKFETYTNPEPCLPCTATLCRP